MATTNYFSAYCPTPWQILGVKLRPFSLGHYIKLRHLGCAFVADEVEYATLPDLLLGLTVCSMASDPDPMNDDFWSWLNDPRQSLWLRVVNAWQRIRGKSELTKAEWEMYWFGRRVGQFEFKAKAQMFADYVSHYSTPPAFQNEPNDSAHSSGAHWSQSTFHVLVSKCGYTQREALNVPLTKALADAFKVLEESGVITLTPHEVVEALEGKAE